MKKSDAKAAGSKLTPYEQEIEDHIDQVVDKSQLTPALKRKIETAARESASRRGGARAGAGRPSRIYVRTQINLAPRSRLKIERIAKLRGIPLSRVIEEAVANLPAV